VREREEKKKKTFSRGSTENEPPGRKGQGGSADDQILSRKRWMGEKPLTDVKGKASIRESGLAET